MTVCIESDEYREEEARLMQDPIIIAMAANVPEDVDLDSWEFISAASHYYNSERNKAGIDHGEFGSIGGPARAIRALQ